MENNQEREKLHLVWGSVFLTAFAAWGMSIMVFVDAGSEADPIAIAMLISMILSLVTVPLLLSVPGSATPRQNACSHSSTTGSCDGS